MSQMSATPTSVSLPKIKELGVGKVSVVDLQGRPEAGEGRGPNPVVRVQHEQERFVSPGYSTDR